MGTFLDLVKRIPIDLGQGAVAETTEGKQIAMRLVPPGAGLTALDLGCRKGAQTRWLEAHGYRVTPVDLEPVCPGAIRVDANAPLPFADESFDLVWASEVIEHLERPSFSLAEMRRVLRPGGDILLTTPNSYMWLFRCLALVGLTPKRIQRHDHLHYFDIRSLRNLVPDAALYGFFPYFGPKMRLRSELAVGLLSPTFVIHLSKADTQRSGM